MVNQGKVSKEKSSIDSNDYVGVNEAKMGPTLFDVLPSAHPTGVKSVQGNYSGSVGGGGRDYLNNTRFSTRFQTSSNNRHQTSINSQSSVTDQEI